MHRVIPPFLAFFLSRALLAEEEIDLSQLGNAFTPYLVERNLWWALLPAASLALVALHLQKIRRNRR